MQCLFDQPLCRTLKGFSCIWVFLRSGLLWIIWCQLNEPVFNELQWPIEKTWQVICDNLQGHGRTEWQRTLADLEKAPDVAYQDNLTDFDSTWGVKGLIITRSNWKVTWKVRPHMNIISWSPLGLRWFSQGGCILVPFLQSNLQFVPKQKRESWGWLVSRYNVLPAVTSFQLISYYSLTAAHYLSLVW